MAVQREILGRTFSLDVSGLDGKTFESKTAALVGGAPGKIYSVAFGPVVQTGALKEAAETGSFVEGRGIIINSPEYARQSKAGEVKLLNPAGTTVSFMTAGQVWVKRSEVETILAAMNGRVLKQFESDSADKDKADDLAIIEVIGFSGNGGSSV